MRYLVLGVGNVGRVVVRDLLVSKNTESILAVDYNIKELEDFSRIIGDDRLFIEKGDVRDVDLTAKQMGSVDIVINSTWYEYNIHAIKAATKAGKDMVDLGGLYWMTKKELELDEEVKKSGITVVVGVGDDPGTSNVFARYGADKMDKVDEIHIRWGSRVLGYSDLSSMFGFSVLTVLDEATLPAILYVNGKLIEASPLSYPEDTYFPEPIGTIKTYAIIHSELATLPYTIPGVKTVTYKDSWDESVFPILDFLRGIGLTSDEEIEINGCKISPKKLLAMLAKPGEPRDIFGCLRVELIGYIGGLKGRLVYFLGPVGYNDDWNVGVTAYTTGIGASIGAQLLGEGYFTEKGVIPPEKISEPGEWIRRLVDRGMNITEVKSDIENIK